MMKISSLACTNHISSAEQSYMTSDYRSGQHRHRAKWWDNEKSLSFPLYQKIILESAGFHDFIKVQYIGETLIIYRFGEWVNELVS